MIPKPTDYSFPSGHTGASFAAVTALWLGGVRRWYFALIPAVLISFSRLYLYVHFPSDILGGILVGVCSGAAAYGLTRLFRNVCSGVNKK
ncbi:MAG TPA: phosphatase PAP2 family protein [Candidatus Scatomonas merdavium]|nr:phosphatase PAP2 family protein [Candidatus Scatomonas merdavium]